MINPRDAVLDKYLETKGAAEAVSAMYRSLDTTSKALREGVGDDATKTGVGQMLVDLTIGLQTNPFMAQYGGRIWPVFHAAVNAYLDHFEYIHTDATQQLTESQRIDVRARTLACSYVKHEIALAALLCEQGGGALRSKSRKMRDELIELGEA